MKTICTLFTISLLIISGIFGLVHCVNFGENDKGQIIFTQSEHNSGIPVSQLRISVVYDNNSYKEGLSTAWGFSCVIEGAKKTILFDTGGDGSILLSNMEKMGINPSNIDLIVLSHIHGDHVGGLQSFLKSNPEVIVYLPKSFPERFKEQIKSYDATVIEVGGAVKIFENVYSSGELGQWIKEQSLIINTDRGLIVITGCAHPGIVEIVHKAKQLVSDQVLLVMGGFHLGGESRGKIEEIIKEFRKFGVYYAGPCHCSGDNARQLFEKEYKSYYINIGVGKVITW